jgi:hypothetical protein
MLLNAPSQGQDPPGTPGGFVDNNDGTYTIYFDVVVGGTYALNVMIGGQHVGGSPVQNVFVAAPEVVAARSFMNGAGRLTAVAGAETVFFVQCVNSFGSYQVSHPE